MYVFNYSIRAIALAGLFLSANLFADDAVTTTTTNESGSAAVDAEKTDARVPASRRKKKSKRAKNKRRHKRVSAADPQNVSDSVKVAAAANEKVTEAPLSADRAPATPVVTGEPSSPGAASTSSFGSNLKDRIALTYVGWLTGPHLDNLDGSQNGSPSNINIDHFFTLGYRFNPDVKLTATQDITQQIGGTYDAPGQQAALVHDPYLTLSDAHLLQSKSYGANVAAYIRYYVPVGHADTLGSNAPGKQKDFNNGLLRAKVDPTKTFLDGALTLSAMSFVYRALPSQDPDAETPNQRDWYVWFYPGIQYQATQQLAPYIRYSTTLEHFGKEKASNGGGHWTRVDENQNIELGFDWTPAPAITITPYTEFGTPGSGVGNAWQFSKNTFGLIAEYDFL